MSFLRCILLSAIISLLSQTIFAAELKLDPSLAIKQEYNDNIYLDAASRSHDFITTFSPGITLETKTESAGVNINARVDQRYYADLKDLNALDQFYKGSFYYLVHPRLNISAKANYSIDSSPDRDILTTGLLLNAVTRERQSYSFSGEHRISEGTLAILSYEYGRDDYYSEKHNDMESQNVNLGVIHDLSYFTLLTKGRTNFGYSRYIYSGAEIDNYTGTVGLSRDLNEIWSLLLDAGARYTTSKFSGSLANANTEQTSQGSGWVGQATLSYKGLLTNGNLTFSQDVMPAYGQIGTTERTSLNFSINRKFTYELSGGLSARYFLNKSSQEQYALQKIDSQTTNVTPSIRYEFTKNTSIEASYNYVFYKDSVANTDADRNLFMVRLYIQHPLFD